MRVWRNVYHLTFVFGIFAASLQGTARVQSQNFSAPLEGPPHASIKLESENLLPRPTLAELKSRLLIKDSSYAEAYLDVVNILGDQNSCSEFFGGPERALDVFNRLAAAMTKTYSSPSLGIRMSGNYMTMINQILGNRYRLFKKAEINALGPFYRQKIFETEPSVPHVGSFPPNTREARALMLLHELGHLIEVRRGHWLLPDDGNSEGQSQQNTMTIERHCAKAIRALPKI